MNIQYIDVLYAADGGSDLIDFIPVSSFAEVGDALDDVWQAWWHVRILQLRIATSILHLRFLKMVPQKRDC